MPNVPVSQQIPVGTGGINPLSVRAPAAAFGVEQSGLQRLGGGLQQLGGGLQRQAARQEAADATSARTAAAETKAAKLSATKAFDAAQKLLVKEQARNDALAANDAYVSILGRWNDWYNDPDTGVRTTRRGKKAVNLAAETPEALTQMQAEPLSGLADNVRQSVLDKLQVTRFRMTGASQTFEFNQKRRVGIQDSRAARASRFTNEVETLNSFMLAGGLELTAGKKFNSKEYFDEVMDQMNDFYLAEGEFSDRTPAEMELVKESERKQFVNQTLLKVAQGVATGDFIPQEVRGIIADNPNDVDPRVAKSLTKGLDQIQINHAASLIEQRALEKIAPFLAKDGDPEIYGDLVIADVQNELGNTAAGKQAIKSLKEKKTIAKNAWDAKNDIKTFDALKDWQAANTEAEKQQVERDFDRDNPKQAGAFRALTSAQATTTGNVELMIDKKVQAAGGMLTPSAWEIEGRELANKGLITGAQYFSILSDTENGQKRTVWAPAIAAIQAAYKDEDITLKATEFGTEDFRPFALSSSVRNRDLAVTPEQYAQGITLLQNWMRETDPTPKEMLDEVNVLFGRTWKDKFNRTLDDRLKNLRQSIGQARSQQLQDVRKAAVIEAPDKVPTDALIDKVQRGTPLLKALDQMSPEQINRLTAAPAVPEVAPVKAKRSAATKRAKQLTAQRESGDRADAERTKRREAEIKQELFKRQRAIDARVERGELSPEDVEGFGGEP